MSKADVIQDEIVYRDREKSSFTDEELLLVFEHSAVGASAAEIREHILPQVYGLDVEYLEFDGSDCDYERCGWGGFSNRCFCGNNRVYWEKQKDGTFSPTAY